VRKPSICGSLDAKRSRDRWNVAIHPIEFSASRTGRRVRETCWSSQRMWGREDFVLSQATAQQGMVEWDSAGRRGCSGAALSRFRPIKIRISILLGTFSQFV
jgi:hypothetical protein